jgi:hypothetical protein
MTKTCHALLFVLFSLIVPPACLAEQKDAANCKVHPLLTRLPDHQIETRAPKQFDASKFSDERRAKNRRTELAKQ